MRRWSIRSYPTARSFGLKLLLLAGTAGLLFLAGLLQSPSQPPDSHAGLARQAGPLSGRLPDRHAVTVAAVSPVDLNRGSAEELRGLPGIGPVLAERVVQYRREHGTFASIRDIQNVKGIGVKRFAQLEPYLHVGPTPLADDRL